MSNLFASEVKLGFNQQHYVPVLKIKQGEMGALAGCWAPQGESFTPLLETVPIGWDWDEDKPAKTLAEHLKAQVLKIPVTGRIRPFFIDTSLIPPEGSGESTIGFLSEQWESAGLLAIPTIDFYDTEPFLHTVASIIQRDQRGCCLRVRPNAYEASEADITAVLTALDCTPSEIDLIFDCREVDEDKVTMLAAALRSFINEFPFIEDWRSFALIGSAFPLNLTNLEAHSQNHLPRSEWKMWQALFSTTKPLLRRPAFGDYGVSHPELSDIDPRLAGASAQLRYALEDSWLVYRERSARDYGYEQFREICQTLIASPYYKGEDFSIGDKDIRKCAQAVTGPGNATIWRQIATSHHLAMVNWQLANLGAP